MQKQIYVLVAVAIVVLGGLSMYMSVLSPAETEKIPPRENIVENSSTSTNATAATVSEKKYTLSEVQEHASKTSCYTVIQGSVYDITPFIGKHPGGQAAIMQICGKDGTKMFSEQHGAGVKQAQILSTLKIGTLAE